ncbi:hypothetical protein U8C41_01710 (plasmid) [Sinorhizobium meliloti]|nr:hypothetical protein [Sinorhizobium meliloti]WQO97584.1 hypothetical protein U8C41_01710 [Sinorhizobium meliloti]
MPFNHVLDHLPDGESFPGIPADIDGIEPVKAQVRIVGAELFWKQHDEAIVVGKSRPA